MNLREDIEQHFTDMKMSFLKVTAAGNVLNPTKTIAIAETVFAAIVAIVLMIDLAGPHLSPDAAFSFVVVFGATIGTAGVWFVIIFCLPSAISGLFRTPAQRTPFQIAIVLVGFALVTSIAYWVVWLATK